MMKEPKIVKTCCVTGHRELPVDKMETVRQELHREILLAIEDGYTAFLSGFAEGVDLIFACQRQSENAEKRQLKFVGFQR